MANENTVIPCKKETRHRLRKFVEYGKDKDARYSYDKALNDILSMVGF